MLSETIWIGTSTRQTIIIAAISAPSDIAPSMTRSAPMVSVMMPASATSALVTDLQAANRAADCRTRER